MIPYQIKILREIIDQNNLKFPETGSAADSYFLFFGSALGWGCS